MFVVYKIVVSYIIFLPLHCCIIHQDVGLWLEEIKLGSYREIFKENGVNGEYLEGMSMFTTEQILRFIRRCHMKWGDFITLCKELRRIKGLSVCLCVFVCIYTCLSKKTSVNFLSLSFLYMTNQMLEIICSSTRYLENFILKQFLLCGEFSFFLFSCYPSHSVGIQGLPCSLVPFAFSRPECQIMHNDLVSIPNFWTIELT